MVSLETFYSNGFSSAFYISNVFNILERMLIICSCGLPCTSLSPDYLHFDWTGFFDGHRGTVLVFQTSEACGNGEL